MKSGRAFLVGVVGGAVMSPLMRMTRTMMGVMPMMHPRPQPADGRPLPSV